MSIGALCGGGELGMIISPGGSVVSSPLALGSSPCLSLVSTHQVNEGTVRVAALVVVASRAGPPGSAGRLSVRFFESNGHLSSSSAFVVRSLGSKDVVLWPPSACPVFSFLTAAVFCS